MIRFIDVLQGVNRMQSYNLLHTPPHVFKYYRYDDSLNDKRFASEVYMSSPLDFNDPCDCQRDVINNATDRIKSKGREWLDNKLLELGYSQVEAHEKAEQLLNDDERIKYEVYKRQLERVGILCLAGTYTDTLMWGYYASNEGYCIEYDITKIVERLVVGFVNELDTVTTQKLFDKDNYGIDPKKRDPKKITEEQLQFVKQFDNRIIPKVTNNLLLEKTPNEIINFLQNVFLKRFSGANIDYSVKMDGSPSTLFFDNANKVSWTKYYKKTNVWKHEREFRIVVSLGGRMAICIGADCIKNIYLGCNIKTKNVLDVITLMNKHKLRAGLYKMRRMENCELCAEPIDAVLLRTMTCDDADEYLRKVCRLRW